MAEDLHGGVCGGGNWYWNSSRNLYGSASPCSLSTNDIGRSFGTNCPMNSGHDDDLQKTTRSSDDSVSDGSSSSHVVIQDVLKPHDEVLQMMGISLSSSTTPDDWNQDFLHDSGRSEENYSHILQEAAALDSSMNYYWQQNEWISTTNLSQDSSSMINSFKQVDQTFQQPMNSISTSTSECAATLSDGFLMNSVSNSFNSPLLETLFDDTDSQPPQQSLLDKRTFNYSSAENYRVNSNEFLSSLPAVSPVANSSFAKQQPTNHYLPSANNARLWNNVRSSFLPSSQSQFLPSSLHSKKPNLPSFSAKHQNEEAKESVAKKASNEPAFKRPRIETPSPLPTFKVRKEKLGDRITALQQLVSPFGKTDTASVLHEAIEYIRFLHDQVNELSSPYLKQRSTPLQRSQAEGTQEGLMQDLKSRGLCLVPVSSTFPVAQTPADFWTPTLGECFK